MESLSFRLLNRNVDQPLKYVANERSGQAATGAPPLTKSSQTLRSREMDSNLRSRSRKQDGYVEGKSLEDRCFSYGGPKDAMGRAARNGNFVAASNRWSAAMPQPNDLSRSLVALDQNSTIIAVVELSHSSWLIRARRSNVARPEMDRKPNSSVFPPSARGN